MKAVKVKFNAFFSGLISFLLALLGFSACSEGINGGGGMAEYGTPSATFKIKGKIVPEGSKTPVKDIQVTLQEVNTWKDGIGISYENPGEVFRDTTLADGSFAFEYVGFPTSKKYIYLIEDIDGDANGTFSSKKDSILFTNPKYKNGNGNWYEGVAEKDFGTIVMKPAKSE